MTVIVCLDDKGGMMFARRRQSMDSALRADVLTLVGDKSLYMNAYSKKQFTEAAENICVNENFLDAAAEQDYCFVEDKALADYEKSIEKLIVYKWNRVYPSDRRLDIDLSEYKLTDTCFFAGSSHEKITREVYVK